MEDGIWGLSMAGPAQCWVEIVQAWLIDNLRACLRKGCSKSTGVESTPATEIEVKVTCNEPLETVEEVTTNAQWTCS